MAVAALLTQELSCICREQTGQQQVAGSNLELLAPVELLDATLANLSRSPMAAQHSHGASTEPGSGVAGSVISLEPEEDRRKEPMFDDDEDEADDASLGANGTTEADEQLQLSDENPNLMKTIMFDDNELDDYDDDHDDDHDDHDDFYSQNPLDKPASSRAGLLQGAWSGPNLGRDIKVLDSDFKDFYESAYRASFEPAGERRRRRRRRKRARAPQSREPYASGSFLHRSLPRSGGRASRAVECATVLSSGHCITYPLIDWATRVARRLLRYEEPEGLESTEPAEALINAAGELVEYTTRVLAARLQLSADEINFELESIDMSRAALWSECPLVFRRPPSCQPSRYRTHTGQCNNLLGAHLGATGMPFVRQLAPAYDDLVGSPRQLAGSGSGRPLPGARLVALSLHQPLPAAADADTDGLEALAGGPGSAEHSALFPAWGQLLNHDLAAASGARPATGHARPCCFRGRAFGGRAPLYSRARLCQPIEIADDDPLYAQFGIRCHEFKRSLAGLRPGCSLGPRVQLNTVTSYLDVSFVYGSSRSGMRSVRGAGRRGRLAMRDHFARAAPSGPLPAPLQRRLKPLLPAQLERPDEECANRRGRWCFRSGDARTNQQIQLVALHTVHNRQHNRLAEALGQLNAAWSDERLYQESRHVHIAMVQHILLNEYLPALLGPRLCQLYNLTESAPGAHWDHYDPSAYSGTEQAFAAAAFRQGHSTVPSFVYRFNQLHEPIGVQPLRAFFRQPYALYEPLALDHFLLGLVDAAANRLDEFVSRELSGHLLQLPDEPVGLDLVAINIQRGRDQGLPGYNAFREWCGLARIQSFGELELFMPNRSAQTMALLYESVDDVDLFSAGTSEYPLPGAQVGPTFACVIGRQFQALRAGDRFWFESSAGPHAFTVDQLESIKQVTLARLICANSDHIVTIQQWALKLPHPILNPRYSCNELPDLDITLWLDPVSLNQDDF